MTQENGDERIVDFLWGALAARVFHPAHVEIIEALRWIGQPLSATDLLGVFEGQSVGPRIERRLGQLARFGAVAPEDTGEAGVPRGQRSNRQEKRPKT